MWNHTLDSMSTQLDSGEAGEGSGNGNDQYQPHIHNSGQDLQIGIQADSTHPRKDPTGVRATEAMYTGGSEDMLGGWCSSVEFFRNDEL